MKLLILDGPRDPRGRECIHYRGTYRAHPTYCDALPEDSAINTLFFWFLEAGGELGVVSDPGKALRFAALWNKQITRPGDFEVIEVTSGDAATETAGEFLGYDMSAGYNNSLLRSGLKSGARPGTVADCVWQEWKSINTSYAPQLNNAGLFPTFQRANECLEAMVKIQDASLGFFEGGDLRRFEITGIYLVSYFPDSASHWESATQPVLLNKRRALSETSE